MIIFAAGNTDYLEKLEGLCGQWSKQIEQVLAESEQMRREADDIGPTAELNYWKTRMAKFNKYLLVYLGLVATKPVFGVSDKARLKPVPSATETS